MTTRPWFRFYRKTLNNPKAQRLKGDLFKAWVNVLCATDDDGNVPPLHDLAFMLRTTTDKARDTVCALVDETLLDSDGLIVTAHDWPEHQRDSDVSAERTRRYRERQRDNDSDVTVTSQRREELETEQKRTPKAPKGATPVPDFEAFWKAYPRTPNMSKAAAAKAWAKQKHHLPPQADLLAAVAKYKSFLTSETKKQNGREYPACHAQRWLNEQRWFGFENQNAAASATHTPDWADAIPKWAAFKASANPAQWNAWLKSAWHSGVESDVVLNVNSQFQAGKIEEIFGAALDAHFGEPIRLLVVKVTVAA